MEKIMEAQGNFNNELSLFDNELNNKFGDRVTPTTVLKTDFLSHLEDEVRAVFVYTESMITKERKTIGSILLPHSLIAAQKELLSLMPFQ